MILLCASPCAKSNTLNHDFCLRHSSVFKKYSAVVINSFSKPQVTRAHVCHMCTRLPPRGGERAGRHPPLMWKREHSGPHTGASRRHEAHEPEEPCRAPAPCQSTPGWSQSSQMSDVLDPSGGREQWKWPVGGTGCCGFRTLTHFPQPSRRSCPGLLT